MSSTLHVRASSSDVASSPSSRPANNEWYGDVAISSSTYTHDLVYGEYKLFKLFQELHRGQTAELVDADHIRNSAPSPSSAGHTVKLASLDAYAGSASARNIELRESSSESNLASVSNVGYVHADQLNGYLSKQFPTIGNPAPLGLFGFALTTFVLSMHNAGAGVNSTGNQSVVIGLAMFYGGIIQFAAGMWELRVGNSFGAAAFCSYGGFWMSFAAINIPSFGFTVTSTVEQSVGIYLFAWSIFSFLMAIAAHRTTIALMGLLFVVGVTFLLLSIGHWGSSVNCIQAGGAFGILASIIAWYCAMAGLMTKENSVFLLPLGDLSKRATLRRTASIKIAPQ